MTRSDSETTSLQLRPLSPRDWDALENWQGQSTLITNPASINAENGTYRLAHHPLAAWWHWFAALPAFPQNPRWSGFVAALNGEVCGTVEVSPFNRTRSTWRIDRLAVHDAAIPAATESPLDTIGSQLLRHCFETIWEARMWLAEVDIEQKSALALYRQNGFQPLAQVTYWEIAPEVLAEKAQQEPDLPNLMPVSNADAQLLYQLDTAAMPPLVRQVFDQQIQDFKVDPLQGLASTAQQWMQREQCIHGYVFEAQRKAAIARFELTACQDRHHYHSAELTVHPAYTWLYPEVMAHMARVLQSYPAAPLRMTSRDYQPEREAYLMQIQATPINRTLMLSRSVWHKVREAKPSALEGLQLPEVLAGLQPAGKPIPGRMGRISDARETSLPLRSASQPRFPENTATETTSPQRPSTEPGGLSGGCSQ